MEERRARNRSKLSPELLLVLQLHRRPLFVGLHLEQLHKSESIMDKSKMRHHQQQSRSGIQMRQHHQQLTFSSISPDFNLFRRWKLPSGGELRFAVDRMNSMSFNLCGGCNSDDGREKGREMGWSRVLYFCSSRQL
ncbi:unnamed protein product [Linum trigynum]|uniref:Uncharacterized protein n=1 Tax=Linum trigynum TaxID=586398 RepID=A0AAV2GRK9_9ROSI